MNNVATPTVSGPTINLQGINSNGVINAVAQTSEIPKVSCVADASRYPAKAGVEDVLLDSNDPEIAYFRKTDVNGFVMVDRRRCIPEPEPTIEEINDRKYMSKEEFKSFTEDFKKFREEMSENVRILTAALSNTLCTAANATVPAADTADTIDRRYVSKSGSNKRNEAADRGCESKS